MRVVVIDDDPLFLRLVQKAVEQADRDCVFLSADGIAAGLAVLRELAELDLRPDLILIDNRLPDGTGVDLLTLVRQEPPLRGIPAVLLSAEMNAVDYQAAMALGAAGYHQKPAGFTPLLELIAGLLAQRA